MKWSKSDGRLRKVKLSEVVFAEEFGRAIISEKMTVIPVLYIPMRSSRTFL
jgi:hypothetical protein